MSKRPRRYALAVALLAAVGASAVTSPALAAKPEFEGPFPNHFQYVGGLIEFTNVNSPTTFVCQKSQGEGSFTGVKAGSVQFTFTECKSGTTSWTSPGAKKGEVKSAVLPIAAGYIKKEPKTIGLELNHGTAQFATWIVGGVAEGGIRGAAIAGLTPVNTKTTQYTLALTSQVKGVQDPLKFEETPRVDLTINMLGGSYEEGALRNSGTLTFEKATELKA